MANKNITQLVTQSGTADPTSLFYTVTGGNTDKSLPLSVLFNNPTFTGATVTGLSNINDVGRNGNDNTPTININISEALNYTASYVTHYGLILNATQLSGGTGDRIGLGVIQTTNATLSGKSCVGISGVAVAAGTALGNYTGMNPRALVPAGLTGPVGAAVGLEADVETHSPVRIRNALRVAGENLSGGSTTHGTVEDAAIAVVTDSGNIAEGFAVGLQFGENPQGFPQNWPITAGGTIIQASNPNVSLAYGLDFSGATAGFTTQAIALPQNTTGGGIQWGTNGTAGKITSTATTTGNTVTFTNGGLSIATGTAGNNVTFNSTSTNTVAGVAIVDTTTLGQAQLSISATSNTNDGAGIKLIGDGATTPSKTLRVTGGAFQIVNDAYNNIPLTLTDGGSLSTLGGINNTTVGATTASTGKFTTLQSTGTFTPSTTSGIVGTTLADNANAGSVGECPTNSTGLASITTATPFNATSISLTAGDWEVSGTVTFVPAGTTTVQAVQAGISTTSATFGAANTGTFNAMAASFNTGSTQAYTSPTVRINVSTTTTVYLVGALAFGVSTAQAEGFIRARRVR